MTKIIKRSVVIKALKTENLVRGWFFKSSENKAEVYPKDCKVCAVGAILRHVSFETWARKNNVDLGDLGVDATNGQYAEDNYKELLEYKNYLGALSNYFELGRTRKQCIDFVKRYFPKSFKLTIRKNG